MVEMAVACDEPSAIDPARAITITKPMLLNLISELPPLTR
jgi:hypothetical protein